MYFYTLALENGRQNLEIIILSKSERERQTPYDITYVWDLKNMIQMNLQNKNRLTE